MALSDRNGDGVTWETGLVPERLRPRAKVTPDPAADEVDIPAVPRKPISRATEPAPPVATTTPQPAPVAPQGPVLSLMGKLQRLKQKHT